MANTLSDDEMQRVEQLVREYLDSHESIRNYQLREISGLVSEQASCFFNRMFESAKLKRIGVYSGTRYVLPNNDANARS